MRRKSSSIWRLVRLRGTRAQDGGGDLREAGRLERGDGVAAAEIEDRR